MKKAIVILLALGLVALGAACYFEFPPAFPPAAPVTRTESVVSQPATPVDPTWKSPTPSADAPLLPGIADVVAKANPAVATITTEQFVSDMFARQVTQTGAGSGWILDKKGIIVTNNHVVQNANKIMIQFADGRTYEGNSSSVSRDSLTDLAIVRVNLTDLPAATIGDSSKLRVGDWLVAIGNPLGKGIRAKEGTVSGLKVSLANDEEESLYDLIETSAAINPGNSGGPLLNMRGEVVGITSAKISEVGVEGMGYAISINSAMPILQELINKGYVTRPYMGAQLATANAYMARYYGLGVDRGAIISYIQPGSPAAKAGLRKLDIIITYQAKDITTAPELLRELRLSKIGDEVSITYVRGKATFNTKVKLVTTPPPGG